MHARYRPPGNGFRHNSVGTVGHHGMQNPEFVNFNYGHGPQIPYPPPLPVPPPKGDIFMEAGRLAAEYLVFEGLLPPDVLPGRWKNGSMNGNHIGNFQESRPHEWENHQMPFEGRSSALARIGNVADGFTGRRRYPDGFNPMRGRNSMRGRKRMGPSRGSGLDWGRENGRSGSWSERSRSSSDIDGEDEFASGSNEERQVGPGNSDTVAEAVADEFQAKTDSSDNIGSKLENTGVPDSTGTKASSSSSKQEICSETDGQLSVVSDDSKLVNPDEEMKDENTNSEIEKQETLEDFEMQHPLEEGDLISNNEDDSVKLSSSSNMPTEEDSALTIVAEDGSNSCEVTVCDGENQQDYSVPTEDAELLIQEDAVDGFPNGTLVNDLASATQCFGIDTSTLLCGASLENADDTVPVLEEKERCTSMPASPDGLLVYDDKPGQDAPGFKNCVDLVKARGEKRAIENDDERGITKKPRECSSSVLSNTGGYFHLPSFGEGPLNSEEGPSSAEKEVTNAVDQHGLVDAALLPKGEEDLDLELREEKQHSPSSVKIFDLNALEASEVTKSLDAEPVHGVPSTFEPENEVIMDIDLPNINSHSRSNDYDSQFADGNEVANLNVDDYTKEGEDLDTSEIKNEIVSSDMETFPNYTESSGHLHDIQDGYNLMVSDFLGTDYANCSIIPGDITSLQTEMDLHHSAGILGDDDQIYLSLGEIPISFLGGWEQPPEYGKPF